MNRRLGLQSLLLLGVVVLSLLPTPTFADSSAEGDPPSPVVTVGPVTRIEAPAAGAPRTLSVDFIGVGVPPEGDAGSEVAFTPDGTKFVVAHRDSHNLVVFDAATRVVLNVWPLSGSPNALAITPDGQTVVTANLWEDTASIVNLATGAETVVGVGDQPGNVRITPDGVLAVVYNTVVETMSVIDIATATEVRVLTYAKGFLRTEAGAFAINYDFSDYKFTPDSTTLIFPNWGTNEIVFHMIATGAQQVVPCTAQPMHIDITPDGAVAVVGHYNTTWLSKIDVPTRTITPYGTGATNSTSPYVAVNPTGTKACIGVSNGVRVVNLTTGVPSATMNTGTVLGIHTTADGQYAIVANYQGSTISYATEAIVKNIPMSHYPDNVAVSPAGPRAVFLSSVRDEMMQVINTNGASGFLEGILPSGPMPEGDKARNVAVGSDGARAVVLNNHSWNATVFDMASGSIAHTPSTGERPCAVAVTPDNTKAVVANADSYFSSVIDLATGVATNVSMGRRGAQVAVSPNSTYAYVAVLADGDGVYRINLNTLATEGAKISTGDMGSVFVIGLENCYSGIALSQDGTTLVTAGTFTDNISIIDTTTWTKVLDFPAGDGPINVVFKPDGSKIYVACQYTDDVRVIGKDALGNWAQLDAVIPTGLDPWRMAMMPDGSKLYVGNVTGKSVSVIDLATNSVSATIPLPADSTHGQPLGLELEGDGSQLWVTASGADVHVISTVTDTLLESVNTGVLTMDLAWSDALNSLLIAGPLGDDGLFIVSQSHFILGDLDCNNQLNTDDIAPFALALVDPDAYEAAYPGCDINRADMNNDLILDGADIQGFVDTLLNP